MSTNKRSSSVSSDILGSSEKDSAKRVKLEDIPTLLK
jgi:hypothetical protein